MAPRRGPGRSGNGPGTPDASRSNVDPSYDNPAPSIIFRPDKHPTTHQMAPNFKSAPICAPSQPPASRQPRRQSVESAMILHRKLDDYPPRVVFRCPLIMRNIGSGTLSVAEVSSSQAGNIPQAPALQLNLFQELLFRSPTPPPPRSPSPPPPSSRIEETRIHVIRNRPYSCLGSQSPSPSSLPSDTAFTLKRARFDDQEVDEGDKDNRRTGMRRRARSTSPTKPTRDRSSSWTDRPSAVVPDRLGSGGNPIIRRFFQRYAEDVQREYQNSNRRAFLSRKQSDKQSPWSPPIQSPLGTQPARYPLPQLGHPIGLDEAALPLFPILLWNQQSSDRLRKAWDVVRTRREAHSTTLDNDSRTTTT